MADVDQILKERGTTNGDMPFQFDLSSRLKHEIRATEGLNETIDGVYEEALDMICLKISRIVVGDAGYADHWDDIAGYATLMSKRIADNDRRMASQRLKEKDIVNAN